MSQLDNKLAHTLLQYIDWLITKINLYQSDTENDEQNKFNSFCRGWYQDINRIIIIEIISSIINYDEHTTYNSRIVQDVLSSQNNYKLSTFADCFNYNLLENLKSNTKFRNITKTNIIELLEVILGNKTIKDILADNNLQHEKLIILFHIKMIPHFIEWVEKSNKLQSIINEINKFQNIMKLHNIEYQFNISIDYLNYIYGIFILDIKKIFELRNIQCLIDIILIL
jgi:hypothetical protein